MKLLLSTAATNDADVIAALKNDAANHLTRVFGKGLWSGRGTAKGVLLGMKGDAKVLVAKDGSRIVGTLRLTSKKPWAIDPAYFSKVDRPLYLVDMVVHPHYQHRGVGRQLMKAAAALAGQWPAQAIRLDAYDADAGAGEFYRKCGYTERGRAMYRTAPLIYYELLLPA